MPHELLAQLSEEELKPPRYYPLNLALGWIAYGYKPLPLDYAYIVYDCKNLEQKDSKKFDDSERSLHLLLRSGKVKSRYFGVTDHWNGNHYHESDWKELKAIEWSGSISGKDCKMFYLSEEESINLAYHNIEIHLEDLLAFYPLDEAESSKDNVEITQTERRSFYKLVYGMAKAKYKYDPNERNSAVANIKTTLLNEGISLDEVTIRKYLKEASTFIKEDNEK